MLKTITVKSMQGFLLLYFAVHMQLSADLLLVTANNDVGGGHKTSQTFQTSQAEEQRDLLSDSFVSPKAKLKATKAQYSSEFLKALESRIIRLFGLKSRPRPNQVQIPEYMIELYQEQQQLHQSGKNADDEEDDGEGDEGGEEPDGAWSARRRDRDRLKKRKRRITLPNDSNTIRSFTLLGMQAMP